jgi:hypothetical protein
MAGIYIHIPFCKQACHYCDFHFSTSLKKKSELVTALITELELRKNEFKTTTVETIYFGGGTPSLLTLEELELIIDAVYTHCLWLACCDCVDQHLHTMHVCCICICECVRACVNSCCECACS